MKLVEIVEHLEGEDIAVIIMRLDGKTFVLGCELSGEDEKDKRHLKWLHRSAELKYEGWKIGQ